MLEYNDLQDLSCEEKLGLLNKDRRYFELIEKPSVIVKVVYIEKVLAHMEWHSKRYGTQPVSFEEYFKDIPPKEETMEELKVYRSNAVHFIRR